MKKITLVCLILCVTVFCLTACASLSTYTDRLGSFYTISNFGDEARANFNEKYGVDVEDYSIIEGVTVTNNEVGASAIIIACWGESGAQDLVADVSGQVAAQNDGTNEYTFMAVSEGRFVLIGEEPAIKDALGLTVKEEADTNADTETDTENDTENETE